MGRYQPGFTLIELLVVVAIVAILLGAGVMSLRPQAEQRLQGEVQKLQQWLDVTCDMALFRHTVVAVVPDKKGLKAFIWQGKAWQPLQETFSWPEGVDVAWQGTQAKWPMVKPPPAPAWLCWPDGGRSQGVIVLKTLHQMQQLKLSQGDAAL